jgi:hypothetical protein
MNGTQFYTMMGIAVACISLLTAILTAVIKGTVAWVHVKIVVDDLSERMIDVEKGVKDAVRGQKRW